MIKHIYALSPIDVELPMRPVTGTSISDQPFIFRIGESWISKNALRSMSWPLADWCFHLLNSVCVDCFNVVRTAGQNVDLYFCPRIIWFSNTNVLNGCFNCLFTFLKNNRVRISTRTAVCGQISCKFMRACWHSRVPCLKCVDWFDSNFYSEHDVNLSALAI